MKNNLNNIYEYSAWLSIRCFMLSLFAFLPINASAAKQPKVNLDSLYQCLDEAIDSSQIYVKVRQQRIDKLTRKLQTESDLRTQYRLALSIFDEYKPFKNDSAAAYITRCINIATQLGDSHAVNDCRARLAFRCSTTGMYPESLDILNSIDTTALDREGMRNYLIAKQHLFSEMCYYTSVPWLKEKYGDTSSQLLTQIFSQLDPNDDEYLLRLEMEYYNKGDFRGALRINDRWMKTIRRGSHRYAVVAFYRFLAYDRLQNSEQVHYWLAESALSDVRNAVMDQGSLWELANRLRNDPANLERSYKYIHFAWTAALTFNTRVRSNQISPVLSLIEGNYQTHIAKINMQLRLIICVVCMLLVAVGALLLYVNRQRHKLQTARWRLDKSNRELKSLNRQLSEHNKMQIELNDMLAQANTSLDESNKIKELYIGRFLSLCSTYIDKTETLRRNIQKRIKNKDYAGLARISTEKSGEWEDFYRNFDSAFQKLFPDFMTDFNALLRPEERIEMPADGSLPTSVRIFALIRLGIDDSSRIAEFLHYSPNTIYNYRAKIKNGAIGDRNNFERKVKEIGMNR